MSKERTAVEHHAGHVSRTAGFALLSLLTLSGCKNGGLNGYADRWEADSISGKHGRGLLQVETPLHDAQVGAEVAVVAAAVVTNLFKRRGAVNLQRNRTPIMP
jgi:hypothetical protein